MTFSIRNKYFGALFLLTIVTYALIFIGFFFIELHEAHTQGTPFSDEYTELFAVLGIMAFTIPFSLLAAWSFAGWIMRPLRQVLQTAEYISKGNLDERIPPMPDQDELATLAETVNEAFDRYAGAVQRLENFSADASHQLRTPLAVIRTSAEVSLQSNRTADEYRETLGDVLEQTGKLNQTIDQLIMLSRINTSMQSSFTSLDLGQLLAKSTAEATDILEDRGIQISFSHDRQPYPIRGDSVLLNEAFSNLLDNSLAVLQDSGTIGIHLTARGRGFVEWRFEDSGPGIPDDEKDHIFDRFYRGKNAAHTGSGLGLAIVQQIIHLHDGTISVGRSDSLGGAAFRIIIPLR